MDIAVFIQDIDNYEVKMQPWVFYKYRLAERGIDIELFYNDEGAFSGPCDAMILHVWQHWLNPKKFNHYHAMKTMEKYAAYRAEYPDTTQIILNHTDDSRHPYALPYWRAGDPVLYRTPPYNRKELNPLAEDKIWAYEIEMGKPCFDTNCADKYKAGLLGPLGGPSEYIQSVIDQTSKVGRYVDREKDSYTEQQVNEIISSCSIVVCPRGWGQSSQAHWDCWLSGKPVLTDRECSLVELVPGQHLKEGVHYLVYDDPADIPDIVSDWTKKSKLEELERIGQNGKRAALSYNAFGRIVEFFERCKQDK